VAAFFSSSNFNFILGGLNEKIFELHFPGTIIQTDSGAHPFSYAMDTGVSVPWGKAAGA
jgi:hypothetical protein